MSDDIDHGAKVDAHGGAVRAGEVGHGSGQLQVAPPPPYDPVEEPAPPADADRQPRPDPHGD